MIYNEHMPITCLQNQSKMDFTKTIAFLVAVVATENDEWTLWESILLLVVIKDYESAFDAV